MRRALFQKRVVPHVQYHASLPVITPIHSNFNFCTINNPKKKHKPKIIIGDDDEKIEEATIEQETHKTTSSPKKTIKISNLKFSSADDENDDKPKSYRDKTHKYIDDYILLGDILPRLQALQNKDSSAITQTMNSMWIANGLTGIPFFLMCWKCSSYLMFPELIFAYLVTRCTTNIFPGLIINKHLIDLYQTKYPLLEQMKFSRKVPDPNLQTVDEMADNLTTKMPKLGIFQRFVNNDDWRFTKLLKNYQLRAYSNPIKYGFAWDVADNTRVIITLPILTTFFHFGGVGTYIESLELHPGLLQWMCIYIGAAYCSRMTANFALRVMALTVIEKRFGLRNESNEYFGNVKQSINDDENNQTLTGGKISSRKLKKNK